MSEQVKIKKNKRNCEADEKKKIKIEKKDILGFIVMATMIMGAAALRCALFLPQVL